MWLGHIRICPGRGAELVTEPICFDQALKGGQLGGASTLSSGRVRVSHGDEMGGTWKGMAGVGGVGEAYLFHGRPWVQWVNVCPHGSSCPGWDWVMDIHNGYGCSWVWILTV
jgi:hypothetical protein